MKLRYMKNNKQRYNHPLRFRRIFKYPLSLRLPEFLCSSLKWNLVLHRLVRGTEESLARVVRKILDTKEYNSNNVRYVQKLKVVYLLLDQLICAVWKSGTGWGYPRNRVNAFKERVKFEVINYLYSERKEYKRISNIVDRHTFVIRVLLPYLQTIYLHIWRYR